MFQLRQLKRRTINIINSQINNNRLILYSSLNLTNGYFYIYDSLQIVVHKFNNIMFNNYIIYPIFNSFSIYINTYRSNNVNTYFIHKHYTITYLKNTKLQITS